MILRRVRRAQNEHVPELWIISYAADESKPVFEHSSQADNRAYVTTALLARHLCSGAHAHFRSLTLEGQHPRYGPDGFMVLEPPRDAAR
jgi:hypothetical protein